MEKSILILSKNPILLAIYAHLSDHPIFDKVVKFVKILQIYKERLQIYKIYKEKFRASIPFLSSSYGYI